MSKPIMSCTVLAVALCVAALYGCAPSPVVASPAAPPEAAVASPAPAAASAEPDHARGGRLYDSWRTEKKLSSVYAYDLASTPELDGKGGPNGNGTLNDGLGRPMVNAGHDYRLRNFFGWDLRGKEGVSGSDYHGEPHVLGRNLLTDPRSPEEIRAWLAKGDAQLPAYGEMLDERDLTDLTEFLVKSRDGAIARPEQVFQLDAGAPRNYVLATGGDAARGQELFEYVCEDCHGKDGRELLLDDAHTLGTFARTKAYEAWFKIQNGLAGSPMKEQIREPTGRAAAQNLLDLLAGLCDRAKFPAGPDRAVEVADGDPRCGAYLK